MNAARETVHRYVRLKELADAVSGRAASGYEMGAIEAGVVKTRAGPSTTTRPATW